MLNGVVFSFPSIAPVLFNRSLGWCSSPSACQFHSAVFFVLPEAVPCASQGKATLYDMSFVSEVLSLPLQMSLMVFGLDPMTVQSLVLFFLCFSFGPANDSSFSYRPSRCHKHFHTEMSGHMFVVTVNPHAKRHGGVVGKLSASSSQME